MNILSGADIDSHYQAGPDPGHIGSSQVSRGGWLKAFRGVPCHLVGASPANQTSHSRHLPNLRLIARMSAVKFDADSFMVLGIT